MKKLIKNIVLFLMPMVVLIVLLPIEKRAKYLALEDDCSNHAIWIYDRINNNSKPVDIAFFGSSHTMNGVDDQLVSANLNGINAVNFAYCRLGRNLNYALLKELITKKKPSCLVLEVREEENRYGHPIFPFIANGKDVVLANPFFNKDFFGDIWTYYSYNIELFQERLYYKEKEEILCSEDFSFSTSIDTAEVDIFIEAQRKRNQPKKLMSKMERSFHFNYARVYLKKINKICKENEIKICFLYMPSYGNIKTDIKQEAFYLKYGKVLIPPKKIFENTSNWYDKNHLNQAGAAKLSSWLADRLREEM